MIRTRGSRMSLFAGIAALLAGACASQASNTAAPQAGEPQDPRHPINLARTSLASVDASSVNGERTMDSPYYGVTNAFDNNNHWIDKINYSAWMPDREELPFIEIRFDVPVTLTTIEVEAACTLLTARVTFADGGEESLVVPEQRALPAKDPGARSTPPFMTPPAIPVGPDAMTVTRIVPSEPVAGVLGLRLQFQRQPMGGSTVHEIRVMGTPPHDAEYEVRIPRVVSSARNARLAAKALLEEWKQSLFEGLTPEVDERTEDVIVTYTKQGQPVCRVRMEKASGRASLVPLAELSPTK